MITRKSDRFFLKVVLGVLITIGIGQHLLILHAQTEQTPTPTPYVSVFDSITPQADNPQPIPSPEETEPPNGVTSQSVEVPTEPTIVAPPRIESVFDQPAQSPPEPLDTQAPVQTRIPSIFDQQSQPTIDAPEPTRIPSIFDQQPDTPPADSAAPTPYTSVFDSEQENVIRYDGEEAPGQAYCLNCHSNPNLQLVLPSGETLTVTVDESAYQASVHGQHGTDGYRCIRCHIGVNEYPHEAVVAETTRDLIIDYSTSCARCHPNNFNETMDGVHLDLLASGNQDAAVCADCHTGHEVLPLSDSVTGDPIPSSGVTSIEMCTSCHVEVYEHYEASVHGQALLVEGNMDVPTCADCHGVHSIEGPSSDSAFRLFSPQICADCHADEVLMAKYGINTNVFDTYVSDFHGTTVMIFQQTSSDQAFNAPVCSDCHGVHQIMEADGETSPVMKENLLQTCQRCHPDASSDFPDAWMGHYEPSFDRTPFVAFADTLYDILIPVIIGGLGLFVSTDVYRRISNRRNDEQEH